MSLLVDIATNALDPGYAEAARRRVEGRPERPSGRAGRHGVVMLVLLATGLLLASAAVQARLRAPAAARARDTLVREVEQRSRDNDRLRSELETLRTRTAADRDRVLAATADGEALSARLAALEAAVGTAPVSGPGLRVRLDDAPTRNGNDGLTSPSRILDRDLQDVINALWAAGAEAIAVNGQRVTAETAIRSAGEAILVDLRPLSPPYVVNATGDPVALETSFGASPTAARFRTYTQVYGIGFSYRRVDSLRLPAASTVDLRFASPAPGSAS